MRVALVQMTASDDPAHNIEQLESALETAARGSADFVCTPEVSNCLSTSRSHQHAVLLPEPRDPTLAAMRRAAQKYGFWLLLGSLALRTADPQGRFANRSFLIDPEGRVKGRYDKIHMFDVDLTETESFRESAAYRPGTRATMVQTPWGGLGLSICYDLRFPELYRALAQAGASFLTIPSAFAPETGVAHWETLLRARAIETGCFVIAPAQTGEHPASNGKSRRTYGHSMVVAPWGEVLVDAGTAPCVTFLDIDPGEVDIARRRVPAVTAPSRWEGP
jgi:predicted amidohydrolase